MTQKKKVGRPATGQDPHFTARLPQEMVDAIEAWATAKGINRSEAVRRLVDLGLKANGK